MKTCSLFTKKYNGVERTLFSTYTPFDGRAEMLLSFLFCMYVGLLLLYYIWKNPIHVLLLCLRYRRAGARFPYCAQYLGWQYVLHCALEVQQTGGAAAAAATTLLNWSPFLCRKLFHLARWMGSENLHRCDYKAKRKYGSLFTCKFH